MRYLYPEVASEVDGGLEPATDPLEQFAASAHTLLSGYDREGEAVEARKRLGFIGRSIDYWGATSFVRDIDARVYDVPDEDLPSTAGETEALLLAYEVEGDVLGALEMAWTLGELARKAKDWDGAVVNFRHSAHYCAGIGSILEGLDVYNENARGVHGYVEELAENQADIIRSTAATASVQNLDLKVRMTS
jgi:hypothetical protein